MDIITKDTGIIDAVQQHPEILEVFAKYGLGCVGCMAAHYETIGQGFFFCPAVVLEVREGHEPVLVEQLIVQALQVLFVADL